MIISLLVWFEQTTMLGIPSAVTKLIAEGKETVAPTAMLINLVLVAIVMIVLWVLAPAMARFLQAPGHEALFRLAALDIPFYGMYLLYRGVAMGQRKFTTVFWSGLVLGSAKLIALAWIVLAGYAISGALVAYIIGSAAAFLFLAIRLPMFPTPLDLGAARIIAQMAVPLAISNVGVSLAHSLDLWLLKALAAPEMDREVGVYAATRVLARTPELVLLPIGSVLFPLVSRSLAQNDLRQVGGYIAGAMRVLWLVLLPTVTLVAIDAEPIVRLLFPPSYHGGGRFLSLQIFGFALLTILVVLLSLLRSSRRLLRPGDRRAGHGRGSARAGIDSHSEIRRDRSCVVLCFDRDRCHHGLGNARLSAVPAPDVGTVFRQRDRRDRCSDRCNARAFGPGFLADPKVYHACVPLCGRALVSGRVASRRPPAASFVALKNACLWSHAILSA